MRSRTRNLLAIVGAGSVGMVAWTAAFGLPWDIDMADAQSVKPFEQRMRQTPDGVVAQPHILTPRGQSYADYTDTTMTSPFPVTEESIALGETMYETYCVMCHGRGMELGSVMQEGRWPAERRMGMEMFVTLIGSITVNPANLTALMTPIPSNNSISPRRILDIPAIRTCHSPIQ